MICIAVYNSKGGTGKTTEAIHLAYGLSFAKPKSRILLIDLDGQNSLKTYLKLKLDKMDAYEFLLEQAPLELCIYNTPININGNICSVDIMPASTKMSNFESKTTHIAGRENLLKVRFDECNASSKYDYVVIDCPPAFSQNTLNALMASDYLVTPSVMDDYVTTSVNYIRENLQIMKRNLRTTNPIFLGVVPTLYDVRQSVSRAIFEGLPSQFKDLKIFKPIRMNAAYKKAQVQRTVVYTSERAPAKATEDNLNFVKEVLFEISKFSKNTEKVKETLVEIDL
jgi:chromosome partitioning protein